MRLVITVTLLVATNIATERAHACECDPSVEGLVAPGNNAPRDSLLWLSIREGQSGCSILASGLLDVGAFALADASGEPVALEVRVLFGSVTPRVGLVNGPDHRELIVLTPLDDAGERRLLDAATEYVLTIHGNEIGRFTTSEVILADTPLPTLELLETSELQDVFVNCDATEFFGQTHTVEHDGFLAVGVYEGSADTAPLERQIHGFGSTSVTQFCGAREDGIPISAIGATLHALDFAGRTSAGVGPFFCAEPDAGVVDAGEEVDAGTEPVDAGAPPIEDDAGTVVIDAGPDRDTMDGCTSTSSPAPVALFAVLTALASRRCRCGRRRAARRHTPP